MNLPDYLFADADEIGIKLEVVNGLATWEASTILLHQSAVVRILKSMQPTDNQPSGCGCFPYPDVDVRFPDGSRKRPDISIYCVELIEDARIVTQIPDAVIEIISKGYEAKDREIGIPFYISQKIRDVVLLDPYTNEVLHYVDGVKNVLQSPVAVTMQCGCVCLV